MMIIVTMVIMMMAIGMAMIMMVDLVTNNKQTLGKGGVSKTDEFLEKFQKGGGSFPIQKFMLQIFAIINASSVMYSGKKAQHDCDVGTQNCNFTLKSFFGAFHDDANLSSVLFLP